MTVMEAPVQPKLEDDMGQYLREIRQFPLLSPEEERQLARLCAQGDENAIRRMVNCNLRLVVSIAREYGGRGVPLLDLVQEGSIGLLAAAKRFDPTLDYRFSTYATKWIRRGITRYLMEQGSLIRIPPHTAVQLRQVLCAQAALLQADGAAPSLEKIGERCGMPPKKVQTLLEQAPQICSLDAPAGEDATLALLLEDLQAPQPQENLVRDELRRTLQALLDTLTDRQSLVLRLHFGMEDGRCHALEEISARLGVSKERVRQIKNQAIKRLKETGAGIGLEDFLDD